MKFPDEKIPLTTVPGWYMTPVRPKYLVDKDRFVTVMDKLTCDMSPVTILENLSLMLHLPKPSYATKNAYFDSIVGCVMFDEKLFNSTIPRDSRAHAMADAAMLAINAHTRNATVLRYNVPSMQ